MLAHPLVAHRAHILRTTPSLPRAYEHDDREDRGGANDEPNGVHRRSHVCLQRAGAVFMRLRFHISPHATQRQYVDASTFSLAALMVAAPQKGQDVGATVGAGVSGRIAFTATSGCFDTGPKLGRSAHHPPGGTTRTLAGSVLDEGSTIHDPVLISAVRLFVLILLQEGTNL